MSERHGHKLPPTLHSVEPVQPPSKNPACVWRVQMVSPTWHAQPSPTEIGYRDLSRGTGNFQDKSDTFLYRNTRESY
jgi:hypothetical protein